MPIHPARKTGEAESLDVSEHQYKDTSWQSENTSLGEGCRIPSVLREPKIDTVREYDRFKALIFPARTGIDIGDQIQASQWPKLRPPELGQQCDTEHQPAETSEEPALNQSPNPY